MAETLRKQKRCSGVGKLAVPAHTHSTMGMECPDCGMLTIPFESGSVRYHRPLGAARKTSPNRLAYLCQDGHELIAHSDSEHEQCPLCRSLAREAALRAALETLIGQLRDGSAYGTYCIIDDEVIRDRPLQAAANKVAALLAAPQGVP